MKYIMYIVAYRNVTFSRQKKQPRLFLHPGPNSILGTNRQFDIFDKSPTTYRAVKVFYNSTICTWMPLTSLGGHE